MKPTLIITFIFLIILLSYFIGNYFIMKNVKLPNYKILTKQKNIELRQYPPLLIAEVTTIGDRKYAASNGFKQLAAFIFGQNRGQHNEAKKINMTSPVLQQEKQKIAMTAPVLQSEIKSKIWIIKFIMPSTYTQQTLPKPDNANIKIVETPASRVLAIRFSGTASTASLKKHKIQLLNYIEKHNLVASGKVEYAFYNPPWTMPMLRRNEILINIE